MYNIPLHNIFNNRNIFLCLFSEQYLSTVYIIMGAIIWCWLTATLTIVDLSSCCLFADYKSQHPNKNQSTRSEEPGDFTIICSIDITSASRPSSFTYALSCLEARTDTVAIQNKQQFHDDDDSQTKITFRQFEGKIWIWFMPFHKLYYYQPLIIITLCYLVFSYRYTETDRPFKCIIFQKITTFASITIASDEYTQKTNKPNNW